MKEGADYLTGQVLDFTSFRSSKCQAKNPIRTLTSFKIIDLPLPTIWQYNSPPVGLTPQYIGLEINARAFLHNQVRILASTMVQLGTHEMNMDDLKKLIDAKDRQLAPKTAPAFPLTLMKSSSESSSSSESEGAHAILRARILATETASVLAAAVGSAILRSSAGLSDIPETMEERRSDRTSTTLGLISAGRRPAPPDSMAALRP
eukprot:gene17181-20469_t